MLRLNECPLLLLQLAPHQAFPVFLGRAAHHLFIKTAEIGGGGKSHRFPDIANFVGAVLQKLVRPADAGSAYIF